MTKRGRQNDNDTNKTVIDVIIVRFLINVEILDRGISRAVHVLLPGMVLGWILTMVFVSL